MPHACTLSIMTLYLRKFQRGQLGNLRELLFSELSRLEKCNRYIKSICIYPCMSTLYAQKHVKATHAHTHTTKSSLQTPHSRHPDRAPVPLPYPSPPPSLIPRMTRKKDPGQGEVNGTRCVVGKLLHPFQLDRQGYGLPRSVQSQQFRLGANKHYNDISINAFL